MNNKTKWATIKNGAGQITGFIEVFWCNSAGRYVTDPRRQPVRAGQVDASSESVREEIEGRGVA